VEFFDVLDENGNKTGEVRSREEVHRLGLWHRTVHVWMVNSHGHLLIQRRALDRPTGAGKWDISAAGHIETGQESVSGALMELEEELGLTFEPHQLELLFTIRRPPRFENGLSLCDFNDVYLVKHDIDASQIQFQKEEVAQVRWIAFEELEQIIQSKNSLFVEHTEEYKKLFAILHKRYG